jgi:protein O-mannosyl-transferase
MKSVRKPNSHPLFATRRPWLPYFGLVALVFAAYSPATRCGFVWDDAYHVTNNSTLRSWEGLRRIWFERDATPQYYPLVHTTFWIEHHLWGNDPRGYHVVNLLLHAAATILFWRVLVRLHVPGTWFAAALFAVHPVEVESVAWITERKNVLAAVFALSSLLAYLRFRQEAVEPAERQTPRRKPSGDSHTGCARPWSWYAVSFAMFVAALLCKTVVSVLPAVLLVIAWWKRGRVTAREVALVVPFFAVAAPLSWQTVWIEKHFVGAAGDAWALSSLQRVLIAGRALWFYAGKLLWPTNLTFFYPRWTIDDRVGWQYLFPLAAVASFVLLWLARGRLGRGPLAAALIFAGVLVPALGFFDVFPMRYSFVADHFQYHASMALFALAGAAAAAMLARITSRRQRFGYAGLGLMLVVLATMTYRQASVYMTAETLYRDTIAKNPESWIAENNLGAALRDQGRIHEAISHWRTAVAIAPGEPELRNNLAGGLIWQGRMAEAAEQLREALRLLPNFAGAHNNLGIALYEQHQYDEAVEHFRSALVVVPDFPNAHNGLAKCLVAQGKLEDAQEHLKEALRLNPRYADAHYTLGLLLEHRGRYAAAVSCFTNATRCDPGFYRAHFHLGALLAKQDRIDDAAAHFIAALQINPAYAEAHNGLGTLLLQRGQIDRAIEAFSEALRLAPDYTEAMANLQTATARKRR